MVIGQNGLVGVLAVHLVTPDINYVKEPVQILLLRMVVVYHVLVLLMIMLTAPCLQTVEVRSLYSLS